MKLILPRNIRSIISIINSKGFSAHIVGGCVRDLLLGRTPKDWDITTNATPLEISSMFRKTVDTGLKHGTITVFYSDEPVEVTTWRSEASYSDHRHPDSIEYAPSLSEDLSRRDFTMNAIAYHPDEGIIDPFNGSADIANKLIRCVGDPMRRFSEDALRMMRAIRFSAVLDFDIENKTYSAIEKCSDDLKYISMERIQAELNKILSSGSPQNIELLWKTHLDKTVFPGIQALPAVWIALAGEISSLYNETSAFHSSVYDQKTVLLALLFYIALSKEDDETGLTLLRRLRYDNNTIRQTDCLVKCLRSFGTCSQRNMRRLSLDFGKEAAAVAKALDGLLKKELHKVSSEPAVCEPADSTDAPIRLSITGADLSRAGLEGKDIGQMLHILSLCVCEKPVLNDAPSLISLAGEIEKSPAWRNRS